ncbi:MAG: helix-turn-helix domain-containing protein, partial [Muribaculaceae bacterium]
KTPSEWIAYITMLNAKTLLKTSDKNIKEIAAELNFPEQYTFRKYFKHHTGMSPKEYRKIIKNNK